MESSKQIFLKMIQKSTYIFRSIDISAMLNEIFNDFWMIFDACTK